MGVGVVNPGDVILWAIGWGGNATELELMEIMIITGRINSTKNAVMRLANNLAFDIDADVG